MTDALQQKMIDGVVKGLVAASTGGGIATLSSTWVGEAAFESFKGRLNAGAEVIFPYEPLPQLLDAWSARVLDESLAGLQAALLVLVVALLALVAHVVVRPSLEPRKPAEGEDGGEQAGGALAAAESPLRGFYRRAHGGVTLAIFLVLAAVLWWAPSQPVLAAAFALLVLPGTLYLVMYAADVRRHRFVPRFAWIACAVLVFSALLTSPRVYGERFFDVELVQVLSDDGTNATFAFLDDPSVLCEIDFADRSLVVWIRELEGRWQPSSSETQTLRGLLERREAPALAAAEAESEVDRILAATLEN